MRRALPLLIFLTLACSHRAHFLERTVSVGDHEYRYRIWLPQNYSKVRKWPVVLYLHGSGERGEDDDRQLDVGLPEALESNPERFKCVVVIPQCATDHEWYGAMETYALGALDATVRDFRGDPRRIYLTGISMGGAGAWYMARLHRRFAAVVPVCGEVIRAPDDPLPEKPPPDLRRILSSPNPYDALAAEIGRTPVWVFHGGADQVISPAESQRMVSALRKRGNMARYTEYPGVGHDAWDMAYDDAAMVEWMLAQELPAPGRL